MIHAYHVIVGAYGFWLPNDPRGAYSDFVAAWELRRFGKASKTLDRKRFEELSLEQQRALAEAKMSLRYPPVRLTGIQARSVGCGFAESVRKSKIGVWACSIMPEHVHLVISRHRYKVEQVANLMKGEATKQLTRDGLHPLRKHTGKRGTPPTPWGARLWKVYLDNEEAILTAIRYVEENPLREEKPAQKWSFVTPFGGLDVGRVYYL